MNRVQRLLDNPKLIDDLTASINGKRTVDTKPLEQELQRLEKELADIDRKKGKYYKLYEEDVLEPRRNLRLRSMNCQRSGSDWSNNKLPCVKKQS
ncbi:hypothetical protein [Paenibacillus tyrfis]|uniref:hypothetical protein n=1 Tax=Paenibacillus tyrfis TaxID=1501230 RepID=UPI000B592B62|nr:hypothetical protein [Paenibacillus tyrfis]